MPVEQIPLPAPESRPRFGLRHLMYATFWIALGLAAIIQFGEGLLFFLLTISPLAIVVGVVVVLVRLRTTQQESLLRVMAIAAERRMPLGPGIEAFAEMCGGGYRRKALGLAYLLESGVPLPQALASVPGLLPRTSVVLACVGWSDGALGTALREAVAAQSSRRAYHYAFLPKLGYLFGVLFVSQLIFSFIMYFISPKFQAIFADFGMTLPDLTIFTFEAGRVLVSTGILPLLVLIELGFLVFVPFSYFGWITWRLPGFDRLLKKSDTATVLRSLAIGVEGGRPLPSSIGVLSSFYPRAWVRRRLARAHRRIEMGDSWISSLRTEGLIGGSDAAILESAQKAGNLTWALRLLADGNDRRLGYRLATLAQLLFPVVVVMVGVLVGVLVVSYFLPLVHLIRMLS